MRASGKRRRCKALTELGSSATAPLKVPQRPRKVCHHSDEGEEEAVEVRKTELVCMAYFTVPTSNPVPPRTATLPSPLSSSPPLSFNLAPAKIERDRESDLYLGQLRGGISLGQNVVSSCDGGLLQETSRKVEEDEQEQIDDEEREERVTQLSSPKGKREGKEGCRGAEEEGC
ncbi:unnamed protein product [Pleuronectes platessa]|uniref:Uncharacterized protein n=1 Tax=Pleuronectes platessa TaxID=8262 RepID=A0A9N7V7D9_PLEPL|nr:unnamed protein product [Pleuronectes platessa]